MTQSSVGRSIGESGSDVMAEGSSATLPMTNRQRAEYEGGGGGGEGSDSDNMDNMEGQMANFTIRKQTSYR